MCLAIPGKSSSSSLASRISAEYAEEQMRLLTSLGEDLEMMREMEGYQFS